MRNISIVLLPLLAFCLAGCGKSYIYKYKITVSIRDHGDLKTASNVVLVKEVSGIDHNPARPVLCGEAVPVPLRNGMVVFALLNGLPYPSVSGQYPWRSSPTWVLLNRLRLPTQWSYEDDTGLLELPKTRESIKLLSYEMPEFVTFDDLAYPTTIKRIDPEHPESSLGEGVRFESVTLQATDERITRGRVKSLLPWLSWWREYLDESPQGDQVRGYKSLQFTNCDFPSRSWWLLNQ